MVAQDFLDVSLDFVVHVVKSHVDLVAFAYVRALSLLIYRIWVHAVEFVHFFKRAFLANRRAVRAFLFSGWSTPLAEHITNVSLWDPTELLFCCFKFSVFIIELLHGYFKSSVDL